MANLSDILAIYTKIILVVFVGRIHTVDPDRELIHDGTILGIFTASNNDYNREKGVRDCIIWGGNLATIISLEEDQEVFKLTNSTHYQCWIGLEKNVINPGAEGYSWVDGSNSLYRKFPNNTPPPQYNQKFMKFRPNNGHSLMEGWIDDNLNDNTNCYLCGKLANSRGCGFTDSGFCYRTYQMDTTINWDDAQSSCVDWGGNLASITSETENELLIRRRPFTGINCWIGMYATNGKIFWNDGTAFTYTNWVNAHSTSSPSCVEWNHGGQKEWLNTNCSSGLKCYICKRAEITIFENEVLSNNKVFGYFTTKFAGRDRNSALRDCIGWGGLLASIASASEDELLYNLAAGNDTQCWIGLEISNRGSDTIIWVDGSDSTYKNYPGETPSTTTTDKYYSLRSMNGGSTGGWDAVNIVQTLSCFYCQRLANQRGCELTNDGSCYRTFETNTPINWDDAQSSCVFWGGNLASITSQQENELLFLRTPYSAIDCWIGLTDRNRTNGDYAWIDGEQFNHNNWASGAPVNTASDDCARAKINGSDEWNTFAYISTTSCHICEKNISRLEREFRYGDIIVAYFTTPQIGILQNTALQECFGWGGSLVTITLSVVDQMLYNTAMGNDVECWIGLEISTRGSESIIWVDGSDSSYRNYPGMIPNNSAIAKYYALRNRNGAIGDGWVSRNPQETLSCYFCRKIANSRGCQLINDGSCYRTFETNNLVNWDTAQANCVYWGGNLASINSSTENDYLYERTPYTATDCWIGMYNISGDGSFSWNDGEALSYTNWDPMDPGTGSCVVYKVGGNNAWNNSTCSTGRMCYTCKRDEFPSYSPQLVSEVTYNGSIYSYYTVNRAGRFRGTELTFSCIFTGGSLATIESLEVDQLLYDLAVSNDTECWIGLEKKIRGIETSIWEDGSLSSYRNIQGQTSVNDEITQYYSLRARNGNRTDGWNGLNPQQTLSCSICKRPVNIRECQFTNNEFCYRTFQLINSRTINWYDAQSNCVMWGGNLASITSENENTLLYLRTPYSAVNCWIGLTNANVNNGVYYWIDGEMLNYSLWTTGAPNIIAINADGCARNRVSGGNEWNNFNCTTTNEAYICKRSNTAQFNPDVGELFGELINGNIGYKEFALNAILYRNVTLICGDVINPSSSSIDWIYSANNDQSVNSTVSANSFNSQSGITYISATLSQQGFYQCRIQKQNGNTSVYTVGVFDISAITVAESGRTYNYTIGIDRENTQLLCTSMNTSIDPINYRWRVGSVVIKDNPFLLSNLANSSSLNFVCDVFNTEIFTIAIIVRAPALTVTYQGSSIQTYTQVYPNTIQLSIQGLKQDFTLSSNIEGRWRLPDGSYRSGSTLSYPYLIQQYTGLYTFYLYNWDGVEVPAIQVNISVQDVSIVQVFNFTETVPYTLGSPSLLYYSNASIPDSLIRWTTETVMEGDVQTFNPEYTNPVPLSTVFSDVGGGQHNITCFYRNSPAMVLGSFILYLKDTENVTISYLGYQKTFSDGNNPSFPTPQLVEIPSNISKVILECSLPKCTWMIEYNANNIIQTTASSNYTITPFQQDKEGTYSLIRTTDSDTMYYTASVNIKVKPITSNINQDSYIIYIGVAASAIVCFVTCLIISIVLIVFLAKKKRKPKQFQSRKLTNEASDSPSKAVEVQDLNTLYSQVNPTRKKEYGNLVEEIDETAFTHSVESANYQNFNNLCKDDDSNYEQVPENPRMIPIPLDVYKTHVNELWQNEGSLENDYETLGGKTHRYNCTIATLDQNRIKNRFKLIYPYDKSRVILLKATPEDPSSDYINASYIPGFYVKESFIAAQAPKDVTLQSFWQMIIENDVSNIVMLTNLVESGRIKCEAYYPVKEGKKLVIGQYEIVLSKEEVLIGYTIRIITVTHQNMKKEIKQFHFTAWPDHDVPDLHDELLSFVEKVHTQQIESDAPILVHCSAGIGRSGTFLALFNLSAAIKEGKAISVYKLIHEMREHRPQMVQTFAQYKFIYLSVLELLLGNTSIQNDEFTNTYELYMQSESEGYVSVFFQQFSELNYQCEKGFMHNCTTALDECNKDKNPIMSVLPNDKNRIILSSRHWGGDYINATSIDANEYIITITPTQSTLQDFFQLIYQVEPSLVIYLATPKELRLIQDGKSDRVVYWPKQGEPIKTDAFTLTSQSSSKFPSMIRNKISMSHNFENNDRIFTQIISTKWNERGEPDLVDVFVLLNYILKFKQDNPVAPIIFHCTDGAGKTGVLFTVFKAVLESREKNFIDIFHIVKKLRNERMNFVSTLIHFVSCFSLMNVYCSKAV